MASNIRAFFRNYLILGALFITQTICLASNFCKFDIKVKQTLKNEGFHRNITYGIIFNTENDERWLYDGCMIGLTQRLPAGVFANPDELSDLRRNKKLNAVLKNPVNIELPTELSTPNNVYITGKIVDGRVNLWLPVHARYHRAVAGGGSARNRIGPPTLFLACPDKRLDACSMNDTPIVFLCNGSSREKCKWKEISYKMLTDTLIWDVPVGNTDHYYVVATGTAIVIIVGSLYLLKAIHDYKVGSKKKSS
ncbi:PREDICTED: phosphatidylinositol-glycan biosynthesis class X protein [Papilio xuthus]|uniref:Phosphatidylinositol-glycan biosynthesis class X protein n=1 Tax=Papilio xuthus TaxID=66420 RepID=A0AAJ6Z2M5_PAPXU|nr:PREDICTED: phosphatidylinositol-glycan biosynthesis class X protein [Papilio xuthus]